jgi:DNA polymerase-3 subunit epsilon
MLRQRRLIVFALREKDKDGYDTVRLVREADPAKIREDVLGIYRSVQQAKRELADLANRRGLCSKLLGLEKTKRACFGYHLKICRGACLGSEPPDLYNARLAEAFQERLPDRWPYDSPVLLEERCPLTRRTEAFLIDDWKIIARLCSDGAGGDDIFPGQKNFDTDTYHLLRRALSGAFKSVKARPVSRKEAESLVYQTFP